MNNGIGFSEIFYFLSMIRSESDHSEMTDPPPRGAAREIITVRPGALLYSQPSHLSTFN